MTPSRTWLVGGISSVHDRLLTAALDGAGWRVDMLHPRTDAGLRMARALGNHGQCNPAHYAVGAVLEHASRSGAASREFAREHAWLTAGSCGPCRLAAFGAEYARVLDNAGLGGLHLARVEPLGMALGSPVEGAPEVDPGTRDALLRAVVLGDALTAAGHARRPWARDPAAIDDWVSNSLDGLADVLARREPLGDPLARARAGLEAVPLDPTRVLPRVLVTGEPWTTLADGDPSYDMARRLGALGVEVDVPLAVDWLHYRIWEEIGDATHESAVTESKARLVRLQRFESELRALWRWLTVRLGLRLEPRPDMRDLAKLARPHYDPDVRGGSAHLEIGRALRAERNRTAHLILSLKPFGCLPSSHVSDGILPVLLRDHGRLRMLALETSGQADAMAESRIDMAVHAAALDAADEFAVACSRRGLTHDEGRQWLAVAPPVDARLPRTFACTAAEQVWRRGVGAQPP